MFERLPPIARLLAVRLVLLALAVVLVLVLLPAAIEAQAALP
ncbi:MAG TPA: hypothetical protein VNJ28_04795 [Candidatus Limnocylindrales bacterium]|nr:hypothetical protein [Candidatus Limnocylindrales bacterium]